MTQEAAARNRLRSEIKLPANINATKDISRAVMYLASTGNGRAWVNGQFMGDESWRLQASWTGFRQRVLYWAADVTDAVTLGSSDGAHVVVGIELGNGWADVLPAGWNGTASDVSVPWKRAGAQRKAIALLSLTFSNGTVATVVTNAPGAPTPEFAGLSTLDADLVFEDSQAVSLPKREEGTVLTSQWTCGGGPRTNDSVYDGEVYDKRRETKGWTQAGWVPPSGLGWQDAIAALPFAKDIALQAQMQPPIKDMQVFAAINMTQT